MEKKTITLSEARKEIATLKKSLIKRLWFVFISGMITAAICFGANTGNFGGFCEILVSAAVFIVAWIRFQRKCNKVKDLEAFNIVPN
jgi:hypothetical protein